MDVIDVAIPDYDAKYAAARGSAPGSLREGWTAYLSRGSKPGDKVLMVAFGAGYTAGAAVMEWTADPARAFLAPGEQTRLGMPRVAEPELAVAG